MFVVDLYLTLSYFVSFVHDYCSASLVRFLRLMSVFYFNSVNVSCSLRDKLFFGFVIFIPASCDTSSNSSSRGLLMFEPVGSSQI